MSDFENMKYMNQRDRAMYWMHYHGKIEGLTALHECSIKDLPKVISDLRNYEGVRIIKNDVYGINQFGKEVRYKEYRLLEGEYERYQKNCKH